jgi:hypothetical protein
MYGDRTCFSCYEDLANVEVECVTVDAITRTVFSSGGWLHAVVSKEPTEVPVEQFEGDWHWVRCNSCGWYGESCDEELEDDERAFIAKVYRWATE